VRARNKNTLDVIEIIFSSIIGEPISLSTLYGIKKEDTPITPHPE